MDQNVVTIGAGANDPGPQQLDQTVLPLPGLHPGSPGRTLGRVSFRTPCPSAGQIEGGRGHGGVRGFGKIEYSCLFVTLAASLSSSHRPAAAAAMATPRDPLPNQRRHLERCWQQECDIDPMILRLRLLRHLGSLRQALCLEQELLPLL
jgi:hypothetical protein